MTPSQWAAQRAQAMERLQTSPAQWAAARQRAMDAGTGGPDGHAPVVFVMKKWREIVQETIKYHQNHQKNHQKANLYQSYNGLIMFFGWNK